MKLSSSSTAPLSKGLSIHWSPDPDKDGKARLALEIK